MKLSLSFSDCEVATVEPSTDGVQIRLSAAHVLRSATEYGEKSTAGYARAVTLRLPGARLPDATRYFIGRVSHGRVRIDNHWSSAVSLPSSAGGHVQLELGFANGSNLALSAGAFECRFEGEPNFSESLFC